MDIVDLIQRDHQELEDLFEELAERARDDRESPDASRIAARLVSAARIHARAEERVVYEALRTRPAPLKAFALAAPHEHENLEITLDKLLVHRPRDEYEVIVRVAHDLFVMHAREQEETEILPAISALLARPERHALAEEMSAEKARIQDQIRRFVGIFARAA